MLNTAFTGWGFAYPIIGAPMGYVAHSSLARAISEAGGLGMLGVGPRDTAAFIEREGQAIHAASPKLRFGIGLMAWRLEKNPDLLTAAIAQQPYLISISFGSLRPYADRVHQAGIRLAAQVSSRAQAIEAQSAGADLIVAQGHEAGGHTGQVGTLTLLQIVLDAVQTPVAVAGGIASPAGLAAVLAAGAAAAWIGTAFLLCPEANVTPEARSRIIAANETSTVHTSVFDRANRLDWPPEYPGRVLRNAFVSKWHGREDEMMSDPEELARFRAGADAKDYDITSIYAGQAIGMLSESRPAAEVVHSLAQGAEKLLTRRLPNPLYGQLHDQIARLPIMAESALIFDPNPEETL